MKKQIKLNNEVSVDLEKLIEGGMVILANSGGGKSYAIRRIVEQAVKNVQVIILDPEGEFASLREKFDFILAGKGADVPVEVRSASMLATKLLELNKSAVIDLYELHPQERQRYVKLFCEALVNAPKNLYHPVLIILDEAHEYVPEGKPSEATWAVEALASKGRKRGQRLILASQRIAKISKNVTAEANNKLIGRASQDIDMKRAGDELGFTKDKLPQLRQLKPGEFFAFGPAISDEVIPVTIGEVKTTHAKVGYKGSVKAPPPSDVIKKILGELHDLPQEAEKEAKTVSELKKENTDLKRMNTNLLKNPFQKDFTEDDIIKMAKPLLDRNDKEWRKIVKEWQDFAERCFKVFRNDADILVRDIKTLLDSEPKNNELYRSGEIPQKEVFKGHVEKPKQPEIRINLPTRPNEIPTTDDLKSDIGICAKKIYSFLYKNSTREFTKVQLGVVTGYSPKSGGFNNAISRLSSLALINKKGDLISISDAVVQDFILESEDYTPELWFRKLGACESKIYRVLWDNPHDHFSKETLGEMTGYSFTSGGFNNAISHLNSIGLLTKISGGLIMLNKELLNL